MRREPMIALSSKVPGDRLLSGEAFLGWAVSVAMSIS
jgi:hypothetical protein